MPFLPLKSAHPLQSCKLARNFARPRRAHLLLLHVSCGMAGGPAAGFGECHREALVTNPQLRSLRKEASQQRAWAAYAMHHWTLPPVPESESPVKAGDLC